MDIGQIAQGYIVQTAPASVSSTPMDAGLQQLIAGGEIVLSGVGLAYLNARSPSEGKTYHESFGYPTDGLVGIGGTLLGFIMILSGAKSAGGHVLRAGLGALAETGIRMGFEKGVNDRKASPQFAAGDNVRHLRPFQSEALQKTSSPSPFERVR